ncbi:MAG: hypothetical protein QXU11_10445 [Thermoproteota archaeon]
MVVERGEEEFYESTRRFPPHTTLLKNMAELCAWPLGIPEKEEKYEEYLKKRIMGCMYYDDVMKNKHGKMESLHPFYNLTDTALSSSATCFSNRKHQAKNQWHVHAAK